MIDEVRIDNDEGQFVLILTGDFDEVCRRYLAQDGATLTLRLPQDAALQLAAQVRSEVQPWADDYADALAEYRSCFCLPTHDDDDPAERMREHADHARKAARENAA